MTLTRPARLTGAALCAVLALVSAVWVLKDLAAVGSPADLLWVWAGDYQYVLRGRATTSLLDPLLLAVSVAAAVAALRSRHAASALAATGAVTLAVRLPGVWGADNTVLVTSLLDIALAVGLLVTTAAGRRDPHSPADQVPTRPLPGRAAAAGTLLLTGALVVLGWEVYVATELPLEYMVDRFLGGRTVMATTLAPPPTWMALTLLGLYGTGALSAFARAGHARAFGLLGGAFLTTFGLAATVAYVRLGTFVHVWDGGSALEILSLLTTVFELLAGTAVLALLAGRGAPAATPARPGPYGPQGAYGPYGYGPPAPPSSPPPGW
ncbi:hypothetical protein [Streptomyces sp. NPDC056144]|uniref:hypothetical protein n=1 Tax=unclassified Streptomyces TaxID=2593676 RepID=UPI0035D6A549